MSPGWVVRRFVWSPLRTLVEVITGIAFYCYVALALGLGGAILASSDRSSNRVVQGMWFGFELLRYGLIALFIWVVAAVYYTLLDREIFLTAWRATYRPWLSDEATG
jgi:hypothetical protein